MQKGGKKEEKDKKTREVKENRKRRGFFLVSLSLFSASSKLLDDYNAHFFCTFEHRHQTNKKKKGRKTPGDKERKKKSGNNPC